MAYYENLMAEQPWSFRPAFSDAWFSDIFTKETETITKALQSSISGVSSNGDFFPSLMLEPLFSKPETTPIHTPTVSGVSENETSVSKQRRSVPPSGRVAKRKSRASKRSATTTFFSADPENFMRMVQQYTGGGGGGFNEQLPGTPMLRNEMYTTADYGLPTLDTSSAFLFDCAASSMVSQPSMAVTEGGAGASDFHFDSFCSFPTLESSKAVE